MAVPTKVNPLPYVGCERVIIYRVETDTAEEYTAGEMIELTQGAISASFQTNAETTTFYADNQAKISDTVITPSASLGYAGDDEMIDKVLYGCTVDGGAVLNNLGAIPNCGIIIALNQGEGEFVVRQYLKVNAVKDGTEINTKSGSTTFTTPTATLTPLMCNYFKDYTRHFYSTNEALKGKTIDDVIEALKTDVSHKFTSMV